MMRITLLKWITPVIAGLFLLSACEKNPTSTAVNPPAGPTFSGAFVVNEGNFQQGNASLSFYDYRQKKIFNNVFKSVNGADLGDVANTMTVVDTIGYIVVNNSDKIEVISTRSFKRITTISLPPGSSPRNMAVSQSNRGYVTNLFANSVTVVNLQNYSIVTSVPVGANPEGVCYTSGKAFVANSGFGFGNTVSVLSSGNNQVVATVPVGDNPQWVQTDQNGRVHVLCAGSYGSDFNSPADDTPGGIWVINPVTDEVLDSLVLELGKHPMELSLSSNSARGFYLYDGRIVEYNTLTLQTVNDSVATGSFYHLRYNDITRQLFVLNAGNFVDPGELIIMDTAGNEQERYTVGIIPGYVEFVN